jgi:ubiquinone/menaquinone biosynthesis C-methylase UbiE
MDIYHKILEVARHGQLHQAPIYVNPNDPPRILDLGCGTGIWAIDMAELVLSTCAFIYYASPTDNLSLANTKRPRYAIKMIIPEALGTDDRCIGCWS